MAHEWKYAGPAGVPGVSSSWECSKCGAKALTDREPEPDVRITKTTGQPTVTCDELIVEEVHEY